MTMSGMRLWGMIVVGAVLAALVPHADAATVTRFERSTNDGVFSLTEAQAAALGAPDAAAIGLLRVRSGRGVSWNAGDDFDATTILNTITRGGGNVDGIFNGPVDQNFDGDVDPNGLFLTYSGDTFDPLGRTVFTNASATTGSIFRAVAFAFSGQVVFRGNSTFTASAALGPADFLEVNTVPLPAGLPLMLTGLAALALIVERRRLASV